MGARWGGRRSSAEAAAGRLRIRIQDGVEVCCWLERAAVPRPGPWPPSVTSTKGVLLEWSTRGRGRGVVGERPTAGESILALFVYSAY